MNIKTATQIALICTGLKAVTSMYWIFFPAVRYSVRSNLNLFTLIDLAFIGSLFGFFLALRLRQAGKDNN